MTTNVETDFQIWQPLYVRLGNLTYIQRGPGAKTVNVHLTEVAEWPTTELGQNITCFTLGEELDDRDEVVDAIKAWHDDFIAPGGPLEDQMRAEGWTL